MVSGCFGPQSVGIDTNATLSDSLEQIRKALPCLGYIGISVNGLREYHNRWSGRPEIDPYGRSMGVVQDLCRDPRARDKLEVTSVATRENIRELPLLMKNWQRRGCGDTACTGPFRWGAWPGIQNCCQTPWSIWICCWGLSGPKKKPACDFICTILSKTSTGLCCSEIPPTIQPRPGIATRSPPSASGWKAAWCLMPGVWHSPGAGLPAVIFMRMTPRCRRCWMIPEHPFPEPAGRLYRISAAADAHIPVRAAAGWWPPAAALNGSCAGEEELIRAFEGVDPACPLYGRCSDI